MGMVCVGTGEKVPVDDGPTRVMKKGGMFQVVTVEGHQYKLPTDSVRLVSSGSENFWVIQIPTVIRVRYKSMIKDVLCCFGTREEGKMVALFHVDEKTLPGIPDGFFYSSLSHLLEEEGLPRTSPAYHASGQEVTTTTKPVDVIEDKRRELREVRGKMEEAAEDEEYRPGTPTYADKDDDEDSVVIVRPSSPAYAPQVEKPLKHTADEVAVLKSREAELESALRKALDEIDAQAKSREEMTTFLVGGKWTRGPRPPTVSSKRQELMEQARDARDAKERENRRLSGIRIVDGIVHIPMPTYVAQEPSKPPVVPSISGPSQNEKGKA
jgi:hypothetical protein